jgi:NTP pyrophosphatase (non-canonical NTP hydrolase)
MNMNDYQAEALSFRVATATPEYALLNLAAEAGELLGLVAKAKRDGYKMDHDLEAKKELGDVLWHVAAVAADYGYTLEDIAVGNINKLTKRKQDNTIQGSAIGR